MPPLSKTQMMHVQMLDIDILLAPDGNNKKAGSTLKS